MRHALHLLAALGLFLAGAAVAVAVVALHQVLWGLALGVAATLASVVALPPRWWSRPPFALGFALLVGVVVRERPEGDYLIPADGYGYVVLGLALLVLVLALAPLPGERRTSAPG